MSHQLFVVRWFNPKLNCPPVTRGKWETPGNDGWSSFYAYGKENALSLSAGLIACWGKEHVYFELFQDRVKNPYKRIPKKDRKERVTKYRDDDDDLWLQ